MNIRLDDGRGLINHQQQLSAIDLNLGIPDQQCVTDIQPQPILGPAQVRLDPACVVTQDASVGETHLAHGYDDRFADEGLPEDGGLVLEELQHAV